MANTKKYVSLDKLGLYDEKIKKLISDADATSLQSAKDYADSLADNYDVAGAAATAKSEAITAAQIYADGKVDELAKGTVKANTDAIAGIKDGTTIDSFADVESALAGKQEAGDYATKTEAQGYANAKDEAIQAAKDAADAAQEDATANALAIETINNTDTGILAQAKSFATTEDAKVQANVDALAGKVGTVPEGSTVMSIISNIQENAYDDTAIVGRMDGIDGKVTTLVGTDTGKSVRTIANEELAAQLIGANAKDSLDTLQEIAAWIQSHPDDASAMNDAIEDLEAIVAGIGGEEEPATVVDYVTAAIDALKIGDYAKAADLTALAGRVSALETASATHATKVEVQAVSDTLKAYTDDHAGDYTNAQIDAAIKVNTDAIAKLNDTYATDAELAAAIEGAKTDASNKDAVVLSEAQRLAGAVQANLDTHTDNGDIHVTTDDKDKWNKALQVADITAGSANGTIAVKGTDVAVTGLGTAAYKADTAFDAAGSAATAESNANVYTDNAIAAFKECSQEDIEALFA